MTLTRLIRHSRVALLSIALAGGAPRLGAQVMIVPGCDREATTALRFGLTGGDLMPASIEVGHDGSVRRLGVENRGPVIGHVTRDSVLALSRRAWRGGFAALPPAPRHPTRNPDAARPFIELASACGFKHVEYAPGEESPLFRELYAGLKRLTAPVTRRK